jgi:hypothetical protein
LEIAALSAVALTVVTCTLLMLAVLVESSRPGQSGAGFRPGTLGGPARSGIQGQSTSDSPPGCGALLQRIATELAIGSQP